jgi:hypothetical protein
MVRLADYSVAITKALIVFLQEIYALFIESDNGAVDNSLYILVNPSVRLFWALFMDGQHIVVTK